MNDMNRHGVFGQLVRQLPLKTAARNADKHATVVYFNDERRVASRRRGFKDLLKPERVRAFAVNPGARVRIGPRRFSIERENGRTFEVSLRCDVRALESDFIESFIAEIAEANSPEDGLWQWLERQLRNYIERADANEAEDDIVACRKFIADRTYNKLGLDVGLKISAPGYDEALDLNPEPFPVYVSDSEERLEFRFEIGLAPEEGSRFVNTITDVPSPAELQRALKEKIVDTLRAKCPMKTFDDDPAEVRRILIESGLDQCYRHAGLRLRYFQVEPRIPFRIQIPPELALDVDCTIEPDQTEIQISHRIQLQLRRPEQFYNRLTVLGVAAETDAVCEWIKLQLDTITKRVLFSRKYVDLLLAFEQTSSTIKEEVRQFFRSYGFEVDQHIATKRLPLQPLIEEGFRLENFEEECHTSDSRVDFPLRVSVHGSPPKPERIRDRLHPLWDWETEFRRACREAAEDVIRRLKPETLHLKFDEKGTFDVQRDDEDKEQRLSPRQRISARIVERIRERYGITSVVADVAPAVDQFAERFDYLTGGKNYGFTIEVSPHASTIERTPYDFEYRVIGLSPGGWHAFQRSVAETEGDPSQHVVQISDTLRKPAEIRLKALDLETLNFSDYRTNEAMRSRIAEEGIHHVRKYFGLEVEILSVDRRKGRIELARHELDSDALDVGTQAVTDDRQGLAERLLELRRHESDLVASELEDEHSIKRLTRIRGEIDDLKEELRPSISDIDDVFRLRGGAAGRSSGLNEIAEIDAERKEEETRSRDEASEG